MRSTEENESEIFAQTKKKNEKQNKTKSEENHRKPRLSFT